MVPPGGMHMATRARNAAVTRSKFFFWVTLVLAVIAFGGFMPTYWLQLPARTFNGPAVLHIHAILCTTWIAFLVSQAWLVSEGRIRNHRDWGLAGIALAAVVTVLGVTVAIVGLRHELELGFGDASRSFLIVPLTAIGLFAGFTAAAIANVHRPEWHKRFMIVGTIGLVEAAAARIGFVLATGGGPGARPGLFPPAPPAPVIITALLLELLIVAGMLYDKRALGRVHPAWWVGAIIYTATTFLRFPIGRTATWIAFADATTRIAG
jgi:uncharacterized membrane protein YozB (DUF420 family)